MSSVYGLDELYQSCLDWIRQHFVRVWPTKAFCALPRDLREKCKQQIVIHMSPDLVLETFLECDKLLTTMHNIKWMETVIHLIGQVSDACCSYLKQHFESVIILKVVKFQKYLDLIKILS